MTNTERIQANNEELRECIETAENLPEAGGTVEVVLQSKTVTPAESTQEITADDGYNGLESVVVNPIPDEYIVPSGTKDITQNGTHDVTEYASVNVNVAGGGSDLPAGYRRVDYIELNGKQLVDTGIIGNQDTKIRASFTWGGSTQNHLFGCASSDNTASITSYMNGSWRFGNKSASKTIGKNNPDLPYAVLLDKTTIGVTGSRSTISDVPDFETIATLLLGGARTAAGDLPASGLVGKVFDFRIWDGDTLLMEMIPVTDGAVFRFWDSVSKTFFDSITDVPLDGGNL